MEDKKVKCHNLDIDTRLKCTPDGYAKFLSSFLSYCLRIRRETESRGGGKKKTPKAPFGERTGEYDTCL